VPLSGFRVDTNSAAMCAHMAVLNLKTKKLHRNIGGGGNQQDSFSTKARPRPSIAKMKDQRHICLKKPKP
jgi:hypothetical protein